MSAQDNWYDGYQKRRKKLYFDLRSRPLTDEEMKEVELLDWQITLDEKPYNEHEKKMEFMNALLNQYKMRETARAVGR